MSRHSLLFIAYFLSNYTIASTQVNLTDGVNRIDLNRNGVEDYVIASTYDRNMSYSNNSLTFFIRLPNGELSIVPAANQDTFTWQDHRIFSGAITIRDNRLFKADDGVFMVVAKKHTANTDSFGPGPFTFEVHGIQQFTQHPGAPLYKWSLLKTFESAGQHVSSEQAYREINNERLKLND